MPFVRIALAGPRLADHQVAALQQGFTALMADILGKRADLTVVAIEQAPAEAWSVGGKGLPSGARCAQVEATITAGTNRTAEKRDFLQAAHALLSQTLGRADAPIYIVVRDTPADDWGFDGRSQAARRISA